MSIAIDGGKSAVSSVYSQASSTQATGTSTSSSSSTTSLSRTITASDFMTLLVTEMKNQDPTQPTDPTQYVQQLVGVNSLEQLIGINQGVSSLNTPTTTTSTKQ